jgi:hypothetical protein
MKNLFITFFFLLITLIWVNATAQQSQFEQANDLLENGEFALAIEAYQSINRDGYESGALWLNMGISYTQLDSLGMAKYSFLKAREFPETSQRANEALQIVNEHFPRQSAVLPELPWIRFLGAVDQTIGLAMLSYIALFFLYSGTLLLIGSWFRADLKRFFRYASYFTFSLSVLLFILISILTYRAERYDDAVMVSREAAVYQQPLESSAVISTAYEGYNMQVDNKESKTEEGWLYIRLENGMYGWIDQDVLKVL